MFTPICVLEGKSIPDVKEAFRNAQRVEQYRVSSNALYLPDCVRVVKNCDHFNYFKNYN